MDLYGYSLAVPSTLRRPDPTIRLERLTPNPQDVSQAALTKIENARDDWGFAC